MAELIVDFFDEVFHISWLVYKIFDICLYFVIASVTLVERGNLGGYLGMA